MIDEFCFRSGILLPKCLSALPRTRSQWVPSNHLVTKSMNPSAWYQRVYIR